MKDILYTAAKGQLDTKKYDTSTSHLFLEDPSALMGFHDLSTLVTSANWEDRIRADMLMRRLEVMMPEGFPVIFEDRGPRNSPFVWVAHPNIDVLNEVFDDYQQMWDNYTAQWGARSRRTLKVGRLNRVSASGVFRPEATAQDILSAAFLTHPDILRQQSGVVKQAHVDWLEKARAEAKR